MTPALPTPSAAAPAARYAALLRVVRLLTAQRSPTALFRVLARELRQVVAWDGIGLALYDATVPQHDFRALEHEPQPGVVPLADVPREETVTWWVYQHQQPLVIPAVDTETRFPQLMARLKTYGIQSVCALPLTTVHRRLGGLGLGSAEANVTGCVNMHENRRFENEVSKKLNEASLASIMIDANDTQARVVYDSI